MTDREMIEAIHAVMCVPFDWTPDVLDVIADILQRGGGYSFPQSTEVDELVEAHNDNAWIGAFGVPMEALAPWRP